MLNHKPRRPELRLNFERIAAFFFFLNGGVSFNLSPQCCMKKPTQKVPCMQGERLSSLLDCFFLHALIQSLPSRKLL